MIIPNAIWTAQDQPNVFIYEVKKDMVRYGTYNRETSVVRTWTLMHRFFERGYACEGFSACPPFHEDFDATDADDFKSAFIRGRQLGVLTFTWPTAGVRSSYNTRRADESVEKWERTMWERRHAKLTSVAETIAFQNKVVSLYHQATRC